jgi:subtilase-type serine protease
MTGPSHRRPARRWRNLLLASVSLLGLSGPAAAQALNEGELRILTLNTWGDRFRTASGGPAAAMSDFLINGNYDILTFQELRTGSNYLTTIRALLQGEGLGTFATGQTSDNGFASRLTGTEGRHTAGVAISFQTIDAQNALPQTTVGTVHLNYFDEPDTRLNQARALNAWAETQTAAGLPVILTGDFNAGDVSERGLHSAEQQSYLFARTIMQTGSALWRQLATEYTPEGQAEAYQAYAASMRAVEANGQQRYRNVIQAYFDANRDEFPGVTSISSMSWRQWEQILAKDMTANGVVFNDETYPVASNTPQTMNILKQNYILLQTDATREGWAPIERGEGVSTWPSAAEDQENNWPSWDRVKIDHFIVSRELGKWYVIADDPNDPYLGVLDETGFANDGRALSDHEPVAHVLKWMGPAIEVTADGSRLIWGEEAASFDEQGGVFHLSRNNMRTDVYLGQVADANGMPTLTGLTLEEKKTLLDCGGSDARFAAAVAQYCIDSHDFIAETLVGNGGTVVVDEDAALGGADARLRLTGNAGLRIDGLELDRLDRDVSLEGEGGFIAVSEAEAVVTASGVFSGDGGLTKRGEGALRLEAENTYAGATVIEEGALVVNGSIAASSLTTVMDGATLAGNGVVGDLVVTAGGRVAPGDFGIGALLVAGDLLMDGGILDVQIGATGHDLLTVAGDFDAVSPFSIRFSFLDDFLPPQDAMFEFLAIEGLFSADLLTLAMLILPQGDDWLGLSLFGSDGRFALAWSDPYAGVSPAPVPLPASALILLSGLGALGALRSRRRKAA